MERLYLLLGRGVDEQGSRDVGAVRQVARAHRAHDHAAVQLVLVASRAATEHSP